MGNIVQKWQIIAIVVVLINTIALVDFILQPLLTVLDLPIPPITIEFNNNNNNNNADIAHRSLNFHNNNTNSNSPSNSHSNSNSNSNSDDNHNNHNNNSDSSNSNSNSNRTGTSTRDSNNNINNNNSNTKSRWETSFEEELRNDQNCSELPIGFPRGVPGTHRLGYMCGRLGSFDGVFDDCEEARDPNRCYLCIPPWGGPHWARDMTLHFRKRERDSRTDRRVHLQYLLQKYTRGGVPKPIDKHMSVTLMVVNQGYLYLFLNFVCALERMLSPEQVISVKENSIIVTTDEESYTRVTKAGFVAIEPLWLGDKYEIEKEAASAFALGSHRWMVCLQILYASDLIHLGYNVILQDTDVVWLKDVRNYFTETNNDIEMACDGRLDDSGPGNTGFVHIRSNCKTQVYMRSLVEYIGLVITGRSGQKLWNVLLREYDFRQLHLRLLRPDLFVNGHQWGLRGKIEKIPQDMWLAHASWTSTHVEKINKFKMLEIWYYNQTLCPQYFDETLNPVPDKHNKEPYRVLSAKDKTWQWSKEARTQNFWVLRKQHMSN